MNIEKNLIGNKMTMTLSGKIDAITAPVVEKEIEVLPKEVTALDIDLEAVAYISSAGLRMLISAQQQMDERNGSLRIVKANDAILEIFEVTGFSEFLPIEY